MLYPTLNQPYVFIIIFLTGLASGLLFDLANFLSLLFNNNKIIKQLFYFLSTISTGFLLFAVNLVTNFGQFRIFILLSFIFALTIERFTLGHLINKFLDKTRKIKIKLPRLKRKKSQQQDLETNKI